jgi:hypothetical protein
VPKPRAKSPKPQPKQPPISPRHLDLLICLLLVLATFAAYSPVRHFDFVNYDDPDYTTGNAHVRSGLTAQGLEWALTSRDAANWFPVTWVLT